MDECHHGDGRVGGSERDPDEHRTGRGEHAGREGNDRCERNRQNQSHWRAELSDGVTLDQVSDRCGVDENAGDIAAGLLYGAYRRGQGTSRDRRSVISAGKPR